MKQSGATKSERHAITGIARQAIRCTLSSQKRQAQPSADEIQTMTQQELYDWSEEARKKRDECVTGRLPLEAFGEWMGYKR